MKMKLELGKLQYYIFQKGFEAPGNLPDSLSQQQRERIILKKQKEVKDFFSDLTTNHENFNRILRGLKLVDLETLMYGDPKERPYHVDIYKIPKPKKIEAALEEQNSKYKYFDKTHWEKIIPIFTLLFKTFAVANRIYQDSSLYDFPNSFEQAYKVLVLFGQTKNPLQAFENYLKQHSFHEASNPLASALKYDLPVFDPSIALPAWLKLISTNGSIVLKNFWRASAIQQILEGNPPRTLQEFLTALSKIKDNNFPQEQMETNPELQKLMEKFYCLPYSSQIMHIVAQRKTRDNLPNLSIIGKDIGHPGYHLVKMPFLDDHAFFLGKITNCCQSIDGHSVKCVVDGITLENNGFYVLLKTESADDLRPPIINGAIDYSNYAIVGQGYAWLDELGNLVFDSWENRTPSREDPVIVNFLEHFANQITLSELNSILEVRIGTGGKTPSTYQTLVQYPKNMREGRLYGDTEQQYIIASNTTKISENRTILQNALCTRLELNPEDSRTQSFLASIDELAYSSEQLNAFLQTFSPDVSIFLKSLLTQEKCLLGELNSNSFNRLLTPEVFTPELGEFLLNQNLESIHTVTILSQLKYPHLILCSEFIKQLSQDPMLDDCFSDYANEITEGVKQLGLSFAPEIMSKKINRTIYKEFTKRTNWWAEGDERSFLIDLLLYNEEAFLYLYNNGQHTNERFKDLLRGLQESAPALLVVQDLHDAFTLAKQFQFFIDETMESALYTAAIQLHASKRVMLAIAKNTDENLFEFMKAHDFGAMRAQKTLKAYFFLKENGLMLDDILLDKIVANPIKAYAYALFSKENILDAVLEAHQHKHFFNGDIDNKAEQLCALVRLFIELVGNPCHHAIAKNTLFENAEHLLDWFTALKQAQLRLNEQLVLRIIGFFDGNDSYGIKFIDLLVPAIKTLNQYPDFDYKKLPNLGFCFFTNVVRAIEELQIPITSRILDILSQKSWNIWAYIASKKHPLQEIHKHLGLDSKLLEFFLEYMDEFKDLMDSPEKFNDLLKDNFLLYPTRFKSLVLETENYH